MALIYVGKKDESESQVIEIHFLNSIVATIFVVEHGFCLNCILTLSSVYVEILQG